jgi:hypothetical protein
VPCFNLIRAKFEVGEILGEVEVKCCCGSWERKEETEGGGAWWGKYLGSGHKVRSLAASHVVMTRCYEI